MQIGEGFDGRFLCGILNKTRLLDILLITYFWGDHRPFTIVARVLKTCSMPEAKENAFATAPLVSYFLVSTYRLLTKTED